ncbi:MAG: hypothetical protein ACP5NP_02315 [Acetobacteraceae bacterium]
MRRLLALVLLLALAACVATVGRMPGFSTHDEQVARDVAAIAAGIRQAR